MRRLAFATLSVALVHAPATTQVAPPEFALDASPRCDAAPESRFQARRIADLGDIYDEPEYFPRAARMAVTARDRSVALVDTMTGGRVAELYPAGPGQPSLVGLSPDGEVMLWNDGEGAIEMRATRTGEFIAQPAALQDGGKPLFSPDGSRMAGSLGRAVVILDGKTGMPVGEPVEAGDPDSAGFSSDGARFITRSKYAGDMAIDARTGRPAYSIAVAAGETVEFDSDGLRALVIGDKGWKLIDPVNGAELAQGERDGANGENARFVGGGAYVLAESAAVTRVIDALTGRVAARAGKLASTASAQVRDFGLEISPDRRTAVTRAPDGTARLWDLARGRGLAELGIFAVGQPAPSDKGPRIVEVAGAPAATGEFLFTPDGERLITDAIDGRLSIWDARTGRRVATVGQYAKGDHVSVAPDGSFALALLADGTATLWNTRSGWRIANLGHFSPDMSETHFLISPDQRLLLISDRETTELWDIERGAKVARRASPADISDAVFSDDSAWLVLRPNAEAAFEIWNARTGGRAGEARPADEATFYKVSGEDILLTRSAAGFAFWDLKRGERAIGCQFSDPGLSMMEIFAADDALSLVIDVGGGKSELWRLERT